MEDRWGYFYILSGHEAVGHCFWCGIPTKRQRRYCSRSHAYLYLTFYHWHDACINVYHRVHDPVCRSDICEKCGDPYHKAVSISSYAKAEIDIHHIDVHHIIPLDGEDRNWNKKNSPNNLLGLCKECHVQIHKDMNRFAREKQRLIIERLELAIQPMLF